MYLAGKEVAAFHLLTALVVSSVLPVQPSSCRIPSTLQDLRAQPYHLLENEQALSTNNNKNKFKFAMVFTSEAN